MFSDLKKRYRKAGLPPESLIYTGIKKTEPPKITLFSYNETQIQEITSSSVAECLAKRLPASTTWVHVDGLQNIDLIQQIGQAFNIHSLVLEDILSTDQRSKVEEFENYVFIVLKMVLWTESKSTFSIEQVSLILGKDFLLTFQEQNDNPFKAIQERLRRNTGRLRENNSDYLAYSLLDSITDQYFVVLEQLGEEIEKTEDIIVHSATAYSTKNLYRLKRQTLLFRKAVWPVREVLSHLMQVKQTLIRPTTIPYLRDIYDHSVQVLDTTETFRDMLANMLDIYLSSIANRTNETMKVLTIIATIFIPVTFIASIYGMNFEYMPELHWRWGYPVVLGIMLLVILVMIIYFKRKKWF